MVARYLELRLFIDTKDPQLLLYVHTPQKENQNKNYLEDWKHFESVPKQVQKKIPRWKTHKFSVFWPLLKVFIKKSKFQ